MQRTFRSYFDLKDTPDVLSIEVEDFLISMTHYSGGSVYLNIHDMNELECQNLMAALQSRLDYLKEKANVTS